MARVAPPDPDSDPARDADPAAVRAASPARLSDQEKKYTLVFLVSLGTTLFLTGATSRRLLARARTRTTTTTPAPTPSPPPPPSPLGPAPIPPRLVPPQPLVQTTASLRAKPLLKSWKHLDSASYFLPNTTLLAASATHAAELDRLDRLHAVGPDADAREAREPLDDGFNPAWYAAKALAIATALTLSAFAAGIGGLMYYLRVDDLDSLSLALSHSLPTVLASHRPHIPSWALPSPKPAVPPGAEEDVPESKEGVAYWVMVQETLDREAAERTEERRRRWEEAERARRRTPSDGPDAKE